jgi:hypothetical protein
VDLNIRKFPEDLHAKIARAAFEAKVPVKQFVIQALSDALNGVRIPVVSISRTAEPRRQKERPALQTRGERGKKQRSSDVRRRVPGSRKPKRTEAGKFCKAHQKPMKDFGTKWLCEGPPAHSEMK